DAEGRVSIDVVSTNRAPVANSDSYSTNEDTVLTVGPPGALSNDTDADANPLAATTPSDPPHGSVTLNSDGSFTYTPDANSNAPAPATYASSDGWGSTATGTVTVNVTAVDAPPVAVADAYATNEDTALTVAAPGVLANDTDVDSYTLTAGSATNPAHGSVTLN